MTREEALQYGHLMFSLEEDKESAMCDFITTAIKALEQEPCEDAISRQAVLDLPRIKTHNQWGNVIKESVDVEDVRQLPPVTPQYTDAEIQKMQDLEFAEIQKAYEIGKAEKPNKWIPVSERLPEVALDEYGIRCSKDVLVCDGADLRVGYFVKNIKRDFNYWVVYGEYYIEPKAWMPLPESFKGNTK